ncbi:MULTISPECIES: F0F1 ATP synthase subunit alpha [unclassified Salipiger]|uniref:F0F1 ATP synthase subunit alpha n=1 Tax=unclassified Salipiger TaxID=2640570 RepID=UPI0013B74538|nr:MULTISPECIES: F0F1 ATP synthase subunit alpha [unclassified Salipiger]NDV49818.1 F0F1 ATP synthase subunit alpha [Salipiger sp. PrR003]NDW32455.1 F0F1 ATP synthase subunit alpha [Salipiger sp. PrR007]
MADRDAAADWLARSRAAVAATPLAPESLAVGRVERVADGIAQVSGLPDIALGALVRFEGGQLGFAHSLGISEIDVVICDDASAIEAGQRVIDTGGVLEVPVGEALLGRVIDPLGRPLDDGAPLPSWPTLPVERPAPAIIDRSEVTEPLETGVLVVDSLFAIGRGQRELIVGDRATGKTSLAVDAIINQRESDVICVYVAIGQPAAAVQRVIEAVHRHGAPERCVYVVGGAATSPGLQWIAPFAGMTIAEYFRDRGQHALIVLDDLTRHAATHRELALLTREPPGREAYPGDIFYLHARLLERAAKLSPELGGGSLTALPIAETDAGNLSAYIPTNLISITDGQIVLDTTLFAASHRPAVDVGLSVSRVGGKAQWPALRQVSGRVRLDYAQFQELEMFTRFGGVPNARVQGRIERGKRIRALLTQPRFSGLSMVGQVAILAALAGGVLDGVSPARIPDLRRRLPGWLEGTAGDEVSSVRASGRLDAAERAALVAAVAALVKDMARGGEVQ